MSFKIITLNANYYILKINFKYKFLFMGIHQEFNTLYFSYIKFIENILKILGILRKQEGTYGLN